MYSVVTTSLLSLLFTIKPVSFKELLKTHLPEFQLAKTSDYANTLNSEYRGKPLFKADFNGDKKHDWAILVVNQKSKRYAVYFILSAQSKYTAIKLLERRYSLKTGFIQNPLFFKAVGDEGLALRKYNSLTNDGTICS